jgi:hypothetical protein
MRPFRQVSLDRRTVLRGGVACIALPWLDAMQKALGPVPEPSPTAVFVFAPNGMNMDAWRMRDDGRKARFGPTLEPLEPYADRTTVWTGLAIDGGRAHGDGPGDHARAAASFLTCAHPRKTGGADLQAGVSIDQVIAAGLAAPNGGASNGVGTPFPSLELGMDRGAAAGVCDSGYSCAYSNNISWRAPDAPVVKEADPRAVFTRLFGDPLAAADRDARRAQQQLDRSILDAVLADAKALRASLGGADRQKLEQYFDSVRALEQRLAREPDAADAVKPPAALLEDPADYPSRLSLMYELIVLALSTGKTRVVTFMLGNGGSNRSYRFLGVPEGHHDLSHHGKQEEKLQSIAKINRFHAEQFATFVGRLQAARTQAGDLLEQSFVVFASGLGDGNRHNHDDLPVLLAGGGAGAVKAQGHVALGKETPMANLYLAIAQGMGVRAASFADSTGPLGMK